MAGDAVNPSLGAWPRLACVRCPAHTARPGLGILPNPPEACLGPMPRTLPPPDPPRLRQFSAICRSTGSDPVAAQRALTPIWNSISDRCVDQGRHLPTTARSNSRRYPQPREPVRGGAVWACRTVGAMDGAVEPPWTGLRRVLQAHTAAPSHGMLAVAVAVAVASASASAGAGCNPAEPPHSATCSTCRGSGLVSGSCQKIIVEVRVIAPTHRKVACSAAVALLLSR